MTIQVIFVCLGNICRSPMAEGVFAHMVAEAGLNDEIAVDSCGTGGWHVGDRPHQGTLKIFKEHDIPYTGLARQLIAADLDRADYLIGMDQSNLSGIHQLGEPQGKARLFLDYAPDQPVREVPDPYYTGRFDEVYDLVVAASEGLLAEIREEFEI